jgi:diadenosine tetraphosphatase ApaH/serine/threonine PP2A family protein phosphatase
MRCAILGDIHANLQALEAVLADARECGCQEFHVLGDVVGYNAKPAECLRIVRDLPGACVLGNHDQASSNDSLLAGFSANATASIAWTRQQLSVEEKAWLAALRPQRQIRNTTLVHATLDSPLSWGYVRTNADAEMSLACQSTPVCFYGHTHVVKAFEKGAGEILLFKNEEEGIQLSPRQKLMINAGSVGQPRDGDPRAAYMIHDEESGGLWLRRVSYDVEAAAAAIRAAGLPERLATRLSKGE